MSNVSWLDWCREFKKSSFTPTLRETYSLFTQGLSIKEIAKKREIKEENVQRHFIVLIVKGLVHIDDIVEKNKQKIILDILDICDSLLEIKKKVGENISYFEIKSVLASLGVEAEKK